MGRKCECCGGTRFEASVVQFVATDGIVDFSNSEDGEITALGAEEETGMVSDEGPYFCVVCGREYERYSSIPTDEEWKEMKEAGDI